MLTAQERELTKNLGIEYLLQEPDANFDSCVDSVSHAVYELIPDGMLPDYDKVRVEVFQILDLHWEDWVDGMRARAWAQARSAQIELNAFIKSRGL